MIAVADAGPLIHLREVNALSLLRIFAELHVPQAIWDETVTKGYIKHVDIRDLGNIIRHKYSRVATEYFIEQNELGYLHPGEQEALYTCCEQGISIVLTDDLAVRKAAKSLRLTAVGSLGVIIKAHRAVVELAVEILEDRIR